MNNSSRTGILGRIIWLVFAIAITILFVRLGFDLFGHTPQATLTQHIYGWSNTLLGPVTWLRQAIGLPVILWGLNFQALIGIVFYVCVGWIITAFLGLSDRRR